MNRILIAILTTSLLLSGCTAPTGEEITDAVNKKVDEEVDKAVEKATEETTKKADELLDKGSSKISDFFNTIIKSEETPAGTSIDTGGTTEQIPVELVKFIDGDTASIKYEGKTISIRYLLIDTPETNHPKLGMQPLGKEAKARNNELLERGQLSIEFDVGERIDKYGRLLGYLFVDGVSVQETLLKEGLARVAFVYPPNTRYLTEFEAAEAQAKKDKLGIWSIDGYVQENGYKK